MKQKLAVLIIIILTASVLPDIALGKAIFPLYKIIALGIEAFAVLQFVKNTGLLKLTVILMMIQGADLMKPLLTKVSFWDLMINPNSPLAGVEMSVALKLLTIMPVIIILWLIMRGRKHSYLVPGDLSAKAAGIPWLGIPDNKLQWGSLSVLSAFLITLGTVALTLITAAGFGMPERLPDLPSCLPVIIPLAAANSFCEGIIYRNAVMAPIKDAFSKDIVVLASAVLFGIAHYYGIPGGFLGAVMSGALGWFMARSMYETNGIATAWIIHFMQDVTIFSILIAFGA